MAVYPLWSWPTVPWFFNLFQKDNLENFKTSKMEKDFSWKIIVGLCTTHANNPFSHFLLIVGKFEFTLPAPISLWDVMTYGIFLEETRRDINNASFQVCKNRILYVQFLERRSKRYSQGWTTEELCMKSATTTLTPKHNSLFRRGFP